MAMWLPTRIRRRGFTLIEAVVALAVVAMTLAAIGNLVNATLRSAIHVESHLSEVETAQRILATPPTRDQIAHGHAKGVTSGQAWAMDAEPFRAAFFAPPPGAKWAPAKVTLTVRGLNGAPFSLEMIRLIPTGAR